MRMLEMTSVKKVAVLSGDGIGPEVMDCAKQVLQAIAKKYDHQFELTEALIGGAAYEKYQEHCPQETLIACQNADAILFGSVGGPVDAQSEEKWKGCEASSILALRKHFNFGINIRPIQMYASLKENSPLSAKIIGNGADIEIFRELSGDIYFGEHKRFVNAEGLRYATDVADYDEVTIRNIVQAAFKRAQARSKVLTSVDKANVLDTSRLWREIVDEEAKQYPDVKYNHMYVDNCAMQLILNPGQFDVLVTANLFGDILSDLASVLPGSLGLVPSISLNKNGFGLYEPSGGSAFDIAGKDIANPIAQILSVSLMLGYSFGMNMEASEINQAIESTLVKGIKTADIAGGSDQVVGTQAFTKALLNEIDQS